MKFNFKIQQYQTDAVDSVVNCFKGQPFIDNVSYRRDIGNKREKQEYSQMSFVSNNEHEILDYTDDFDESGFKNENLLISSDMVLANIKDVQQNNNVMISDSLVDSSSCTMGCGTVDLINSPYNFRKSRQASIFGNILPSLNSPVCI